ncbi:MAG: hypothetical protein COB75_07495, partial [Idiomarina sp.]
MSESNTKGTRLSLANRHFNAGSYADAIEIYVEVGKAIPPLRESLTYNIKRAFSRSSSLRLRNIKGSFFSQENSRLILELLKIDNNKINKQDLIKPEGLEDYYYEKILESKLFDSDYYYNQYKPHLNGV